MQNLVKNIYSHLKTALLNYPISFIALIALFIIFEYTIFNSNNIAYETMLKFTNIMISLVLLTILSLAVYNFKIENNIYKALSMMAVIIFAIVFYYYLPNTDYTNIQEYYIFVVFIISFSLLVLAGYKENFLSYILNLIKTFLKTFVVAIVILLAGYIAFGAVNSLFNLHFNKIYGYYFGLIFILFAGIYFMGELKNLYKKFEYDKLTKFLLLYILIPAIFIYFLILIIYDIKLLFSIPNWPSRIAPYLIIIFSLIGYFIYIISSELDEAKTYRKYFPILVLSQLPILIISIYLRVGQYGLTFNRYLLIIFTIFLAIISLYLIFSKKKNLAYIFGFTILLLGITSIGPCSVNNLPAKIQETKLVKILKENNLLSGDTINVEKIKNEKDSVKYLIADKVRYLCKNHGCENINILKPLVEKIKSENKKLSNWELMYKINESLGIENYYIGKNNIKYFHVNNPSYYNRTYVFSYSYIINIIPEKYKKLDNEGYYITADKDGFIYLYEDKKLIDKKQIPQSLLEKIYNQKKQLEKPIEIVFNMGKYEVKILLYSFQLQKIGNKIVFSYVPESKGLLKIR